MFKNGKREVGKEKNSGREEIKKQKEKEGKGRRGKKRLKEKLGGLAGWLSG